MQVKNKPPKYIRLHNTAMRLTQKQRNWGEPEAGFHYWRDAGLWGIDFRFDEIEQKWYSVSIREETDWLNDKELIPITRKEYREENKGYL